MNARRSSLSVVLWAGFLICCNVACADSSFPTRPIRLIVAAPPGGTTYTLGRLIAEETTKLLNQPIVADPRPGGSGILAANITTHATPDGYTLMLTYTAFTITAAQGKKLPYDVIKGFTPITQLIRAGSILTVNSTAPVKTLPEFISWTKNYKGDLNAGVPGVGSGGYLAAELYNQMTGAKAEIINHVGTAPALIGLMANRYQYAFTGPAAAMVQVHNGKLRALAVTTPKRLAALPDIPAMAEALPGFDVTGWWGIVGPAGLPKRLVVQLCDAFVHALNVPAVHKVLLFEGAEPVGSSPEQFAQLIKSNLAEWPKILKGVPQE